MTLKPNGKGLNIKIVSYLISLLITASVLTLVLGCTPSAASPLPPQPRLRVATTTSLYDTGLWGYLEPMFEKKYDVELDILSAGSGKAAEYGKRGDVDAVTLHDKPLEEQFVAEGYGVARVPFAYNYFLIVGPKADPAGIKDLSPAAAFNKLMTTQNASFVSRGDNSGTHTMEQTIWKAAGYDYEVVRKSGKWYIEAGSGMGATLMMASEKEAYTLTDIGTYLAFQRKLELVPLIEKNDILLNVYTVIAVNPQKVAGVKIELVNKLIDFLTSPEIQEAIGNYGVKEYGKPLFTPYVGAKPK